MKGAVEQPPATAGIVMANWYWKVVRQFVSERFGISLSRSSCLNWLHRLGFACKRPKKRRLKADESKRETFVAEYAVLWEEAQRTGASIFFADEAHFRADAELRGKWVLKGKPALVDSSSPRYGEKASYYSAVCLETGEEWMELGATATAGPGPAEGHKPMRRGGLEQPEVAGRRPATIRRCAWRRARWKNWLEPGATTRTGGQQQQRDRQIGCLRRRS